jgi:cytochrome c oxidase subunit 2
MLWLMWRYRRKSHTDQTEYVEGKASLELVWAVIPTILVIILFFWGFNAFVKASIAPANAYEIRVVAKKWSWDFEYPNGHISTNDLYVPADIPVKLIMTSTDVLHSFYVPEFRVKHDVIPNRYSTVWFTATDETGLPEDPMNPSGYIQIFCTEYCGTGHSAMGARLWTLPKDEFDDWLATAGAQFDDLPLPELGEMLYTSKTCIACHSIDGSPGVGPTFKGLFGKQERFADGSTGVADEDYLRESIVAPAAKIVEGYQPVMPPFLLEERELSGLIEYIKLQQ